LVLLGLVWANAAAHKASAQASSVLLSFMVSFFGCDGTGGDFTVKMPPQINAAGIAAILRFQDVGASI
jgi:hypothetical protein